MEPPTADRPEETPVITPDTNVDELVSLYPSTIRVFIQHRMLCVGCEVARFETLAEACEIYHRPLEPLLADLRSAVAGRPK
jgi:hybrid cluster-associated redox disulfide protein